MQYPRPGAGARRVRSLALAAATALSIASVAAQPAPAAEAEASPTFAITRYDVQGNTLLPADEILRLLAPWTGERRGFADVRGAVQALESAYRARGYDAVSVQLPEQELDGGTVRVQVVEPRIGQVRVFGNRQFTTGNVRASLPGLREGTAPNLREVSSSLKVANTNPAKQTALELQAGDAADTIDATIRVQESRPWRVGLTADNTGTAETGRARTGVVLQHANLWGLDHVGSLQYITSPQEPSRVQIWSAGYHVPLYALGDSLDFFATRASVDSGAVTAGVLNLLVSGKGTVMGARYNHTLPQWRDLASTVTVGIDRRVYENSIALQGVQLGSDLTVHPLQLTYSGQLSLESAQVGVQLSGVQNIPGGSDGRDADFARQRAGATAGYRLVRYGASYTRRLASSWLVRLQANGQASADALVPGEQFGAGGPGSVRGFRPREVTGDRGTYAGAELETPDWCGPGASHGLQCRGVAFLEGATVSRNNPQAGEAARTSIAAAGAGLRFALDGNSTLQVDYGRVVDGGGVAERGRGRLHLQLSLLY